MTNRQIPNPNVIDSGIKKATVSNIEFNGSGSSSEGTLSFKATIIYENIGGDNIESDEEGTIRLIEEDGELKVDYFTITSP